MANRPKNQHWVPRFYLRHFATPETRAADEAQIWMFSNEEPGGDEVLTNIKNVCTRRYFYSPVDHSGQRLWELEEKLAELESSLAPWWPVITGELVDFGDPDFRKAVALFVSVMHLRGPDSLRTIEAIHRQLVALYETAPKNPDGTPNVEIVDATGNVRPLDTRNWEQYRTAGPNDHRRFFARTIQSEAIHIAERLLEKRWSVVSAEEDAFVTSDRPVSLQNQHREVFGVGTPGSMVTFPLTPRRVLVMDDRHEQPANQYYPVKPGMVGSLNFLIWRNGRVLLTGRPVPDVLSELIAGLPEARDCALRRS